MPLFISKNYARLQNIHNHGAVVAKRFELCVFDTITVRRIILYRLIDNIFSGL